MTISKEEFVKIMMRNEEWKRNEKIRQERYKKKQADLSYRSHLYCTCAKDIRKKNNR